MPEHLQNAAENILNTIVENIANNVPKQTSVRFSEEQNTVPTQMNKLVGRQKSIHKILGGGKSADVLLWRNKKISSSVLTGATATWVLFEWLQYNILTILCFALVIGMLIQFLWSNASDMLSRSPSQVPRLVLPEELFINIAVCIGAQINQFLGFIQDVACGRNLRQSLVVVVSLWAAAVIGSWCNFLTVLYIGFVCAHTLPVLYEKYEDQVDDFVYNLIGQLQNRYRKVDASVFSKMAKGKL
ncbi:reticulon-like protein B8 isoform X1 [Phoenix dactylifera]|uniref:Reticulon-like protein n=1 Tax=Phoenix dactylifera TaxID=42345 RepID=A0A8B7D2F4_PHODC|nr:reticulon-like protein B8 isoform X1 [Phoenix dactylifera]XP_026655688.2 reticulon-like protein B8 isoform X1 [Phoenix dactylifera]